MSAPPKPSRWPFLGLREHDACALVRSHLQIWRGPSARLQSSSLQGEFAANPQALNQDFKLKKCSVNVLHGSSKLGPGLNICLLENIPQLVCNFFANQGQRLHWKRTKLIVPGETSEPPVDISDQAAGQSDLGFRATSSHTGAGWHVWLLSTWNVTGLQKQTHRHREQTCGCQEWEWTEEGMGWGFGVSRCKRLCTG